MTRRLAFLTAVFMLVFSVSAFAQDFSDMPAPDSKYYPALDYAVQNKIISGVDGKILPDNPVTLAEAVTFISRVKNLGDATADMSKVVDVPADAWYYSTMSKAVGAKLITPDAEGKLNPTAPLSRRAAWDLVVKALGNTASYTPVADGDKPATRADFVLWIYQFVKPTNVPVEGATVSATEAATEFSDIKAQQALEAMQVALGIRADGTSYVNVTVYKDATQTDWGGYGTGGASSSRPSGGSNRPSSGNNNNNNNDNDNNDEPTEEENTPTEPETQAPTEPVTQAPTEPETQAPTYGEYDGPIDNDKDNVIDDPFDDGWRPPGYEGGDSDDGDDDQGGGGYDEEDDFIVNDDIDPDQNVTEAPTEPETEAPTDAPSEDETEAPTDAPTDGETDEPTDAPTDGETDEPTDAPTDGETDEPTDAPTDGETDEPTDAPTDGETDEPTDAPTDGETDEPTDEPTAGETGDPTDEPATEPKDEEDEGSETDENTDQPEGADEGEQASLMSKDWWFD